MLSFPDASGSTPAKSARSEFSSPLDSGFHPQCVLLLVLQSTTAQAAESGFKSSSYRRRVVACCFCRSRGKHDVSPLSDFGKMKSIRATKTPSYVMTSRTNTRRWVQRDGREEDVHRRALCVGFTEMGEHGAAAARTVCAPIRQTILLSPHTLLSGLISLHHRQDRMHLSDAVTRLETPYTGVRG